MNYKKMFENSFSSVSPLKNNDELLKIVTERKKTMKNSKKISIKKSAVIVIAAAAVLSLGITAAANFDLPSLFTKSVNDRADEMEEFMDSEYYDSVEHWYPEISEINVPVEVIEEAASEASGVPEAEKKLTIAERITREYNKLIECDGYDIQIKGYAYDGYSVQIFMDFIFDKDGKYYKDGALTLNDPASLFVTWYDVPSGGSGQVLAVNDNIISYKTGDDLNVCYGEEDAETMRVSVVPAEALENAPEIFDDSCYSFILEKPEIDDLIYEKEFDRPFELVGYGTATLKKVTVSPLQINISFTEKSFEEPALYRPCYITMKNGEILELPSAGGSATDYKGVYNIIISSGDIMLLDINEIKSIQVYNEIIEIG